MPQLETKISLVRHGLVHNPQQIFYQRMPRFRLADEGKDQARAAAELLKSEQVAQIIASPLLRAQQTAKIIAGPHKMNVMTSALLNEVYTPYEGRSYVELDGRKWDLYSESHPPYEQPLHVWSRVQKFIRRTRRAYPDQHVVAVSHGDVIAFTVLWAMGMTVDVRVARTELPKLDPVANYIAHCSVSTLTFLTDDMGEMPQFEYRRPY